MSFCNKVVLITGGSSGIGAVTAVQFAKEGASIAIVGRNEDNLKAVANQCQEFKVSTLIIKADLTKDEEIKTVIEKTIQKYGQLNVLVNNAAIVETGGILNGSFLSSFDNIMSTNLRSVVQLTCLAVPYLIASKGNIVNVSSILGTAASSWMLAYSVSKSGLEQFSRVVALELASSGVRVNIVSPGTVDTTFFKNSGAPSNVEYWGKKAPLRKPALPEEVADVIMFLASDKAKCITGSNYVIDNGILLCHIFSK